MAKSAFLFLVLCGTLMLGTSCASIISDSVYPVSILSSPAGARVEVKNPYGVSIASGRTPMLVSLDAGAVFFQPAKYQIHCLSEEGEEVSVIPLHARLDGWYVGNILFGGFIGWLIVDPATGAMWKLPNMISVAGPPETARIK